ncbi:hypothetical protein MtrunA17_Chr4g0027641 [Medicago truncatula]|uniref:Uncharacterized protein n=1 Tax=Medicago truncatula TaxID=3880 RepID=A0A396I7B9_MEDTR|nr:hypothetical protein MtrunA17_Chr4g0027641 [Medicago truncatula]
MLLRFRFLPFLLWVLLGYGVTAQIQRRSVISIGLVAVDSFVLLSPSYVVE